MYIDDNKCQTTIIKFLLVIILIEAILMKKINKKALSKYLK